MDPLEKRLSALREALNEIEQPDKNRIWADMQRKQRRRRFRRYALSAAAAIAVLVGAFGLVRHREMADYSSEQALMAALPPEQQAAIAQYQQEIADKEKFLRSSVADHETKQEWTTELQIMEANQQQFRSDLAALPKDDRYAETVIRFYEQKSRMLDLFSKKIQIQNNEKERITQERI